MFFAKLNTIKKYKNNSQYHDFKIRCQNIFVFHEINE